MTGKIAIFTTTGCGVIVISFSFFKASGVTVPNLLGYQVTIVNSTDPNDVNEESGLLSPEATNHKFIGIPTGRTLVVTVIAINGVGNSSLSNTISKLIACE